MTNKLRASARVALLAFACAIACAACSEPINHWVEIDPGRFYRSATPKDGELEDAAQRFGIRTVLNLRTLEERAKGDWWEKEQAQANARGIEIVTVPIPSGTPPTPEQISEILALFDDPARYPILIHCQYGVVRSAAVEGMYRIEKLGESGEEAFSKVATFGRDLDEKYPDIARFIRSYVPRPGAVGTQPPSTTSPPG